ncbi:fused DSP-PTPase phosphatase/NAD kinase-like protein [Thiosulfativibrio zosterae]|uniref:Protein-tyrosine-phosphatase n=1 Tax=Thiosulfativibrio zosterae TaxID=2675053 RepID=A0A6F8PPJ0_9GAMM|nr:tyrosine-protein phosphatase [Thiosulfativibrio zosterae]BBP44033.1 protein-tyrosine-phosphatase [Thiosulfativibrio zosterae]
MYQIKTPWQRIKAHLSAWLIDHEILRVFFRNFYRISDKAYRSNHPSPGFIKTLKEKHDIKTIINLRGANKTGQYMLEKEACEKYDIKLISIPFSSRSAPWPEDIHDIFNAFDHAEYPILLHCKSGADRAGLGSALYEFYVENIPLSESKQLDIKYGHIKSSETGVLDFFIQKWTEYHLANPEVPFLTWVDTTYDYKAINAEFKASKWSNLLVNKILRRE